MSECFVCGVWCQMPTIALVLARLSTLPPSFPRSFKITYFPLPHPPPSLSCKINFCQTPTPLGVWHLKLIWLKVVTMVIEFSEIKVIYKKYFLYEMGKYIFQIIFAVNLHLKLCLCPAKLLGNANFALPNYGAIPTLPSKLSEPSYFDPQNHRACT